MKRPLSALLALVLSLGSVPAQAQTALGKIAAPTVSAPAVVPSALSVPSLGSPLSAASIPLLPSGLAVLTPAPHLSVVPSALSFKAAVAVPSAASTPGRPLDVLRAVSVSETPAALFDASRTRSAPSTGEPVRRNPEPESAAAPKKKGLLARYAEHRKKPSGLGGVFGKSLVLATIAGTALPPLMNAAPAMKAVYAAAMSNAALVALLVPAMILFWAARKLRRAPQTAAKPPPARRAKLLVAGLAVAMGLSLGLTPYAADGPLVERVTAHMERDKPADEQSHARWVSGGAMEDETVKELSKNAVGREILDKLRDRFGVLRLPPMFVSHQDDSYAEHENMFDGVYLNENEITGRGWTVEQFLKDPALQRRLIREMNSTVLHELVHAVQGRRPPWTPGYFKNSVECEQEAFFYQTLFVLAELEANPAMPNNGGHSWLLVELADDLDSFLGNIAAIYPENVVVGDPYFRDFLAAQRARWPVFRVHVYQVLAAHAPGPGSAKMYMDKARAAAKKAGLPEPAPLVAAR